uniref:Uncharacterized protein n=1 Tax=Siphoviridae sp. ctiJI15 TaxID=2826431 RepID=A0A8S5NJC2_9CAUD|nr:MAG TPA: hypothetical protein [Siphoviridae sp. ctiJI15]
MNIFTSLKYFYFRQIPTQQFNIKCYNIIKEMIVMGKACKDSLQMIKVLNIKNEKEYNKLLKFYLILSSESLKGRLRTRRFKKIIRLAKEV